VQVFCKHSRFAAAPEPPPFVPSSVIHTPPCKLCPVNSCPFHLQAQIIHSSSSACTPHPTYLAPSSAPPPGDATPHCCCCQMDLTGHCPTASSAKTAHPLHEIAALVAPQARAAAAARRPLCLPCRCSLLPAAPLPPTSSCKQVASSSNSRDISASRHGLLLHPIVTSLSHAGRQQASAQQAGSQQQQQ
jgi:hypothetical protein